MADITMCQDTNCPKNEQCYRYTAVQNPWRQAYFLATPRKDGECKEFVWNGQKEAA